MNIIYAAYSVVSMPFFMACLFPLCIQIMRGGVWYLLAPIVMVFGIVDIMANYSILALLMMDIPQRGEWTFSRRLERLCLRSDWRGSISRRISYGLNAFTPDYKHIENASIFVLSIK